MRKNWRILTWSKTNNILKTGTMVDRQPFKLNPFGCPGSRDPTSNSVVCPTLSIKLTIAIVRNFPPCFGWEAKKAFINSQATSALIMFATNFGPGKQESGGRDQLDRSRPLPSVVVGSAIKIHSTSCCLFATQQTYDLLIDSRSV